MKNKGFTLIELLAVLIIIGLIAIITIPKINDSVENGKKNLAKTSSLNYLKAVKESTLKQHLKNNIVELNGDYEINENGNIQINDTEYNIDINGEKPKNGYLTYINDNLQSGCLTINKYAVTLENDEVKKIEKGDCLKILQVRTETGVKANTYLKAALLFYSAEGNNQITKETVKNVSGITTNGLTKPQGLSNNGWIHFVYSETNGLSIKDYSLKFDDYVASYLTIENDNYISTISNGNEAKKPKITGDEICFGPTNSQECFKVVTSNSNTTLLLAKYNLKKYTNNTTNPATITYKQETSSPDTIKFSQTNYWNNSGTLVSTYSNNGEYSYDSSNDIFVDTNNTQVYPDVYSSNSNTYAYVEGYLDTLQNETYKLPSTAAGRLLTEKEANEIISNSWAYNQSYWLSSANDFYVVLYVSSNGTISKGFRCDNSSCNYGVRPVIIIPTSDL